MKPNSQAAIAILKNIQDVCGTASLAYWVGPNAILTLSGARAFCDGVFWGEDQDQLKIWNKEINASLKVIQSVSGVVSADAAVDKVRDEEFCARYDLALETGLDQSVRQTDLIDSGLIPKLKAQKTLPLLMEILVNELKDQSRFKTFDKDDINDIAFGILLGYPDAAILSLRDALVEKPFAEPLINADIRGANYYICPRPVYDYPRHLIHNKKIQTHEQLWSKILHDYYTSDFHKTLETDPDFQKKMSDLGNLP